MLILDLPVGLKPELAKPSGPSVKFDEFERAYLLMLMQKFPKETVSGLCFRAGIAKATFYRMMRRHKLVKETRSHNKSGVQYVSFDRTMSRWIVKINKKQKQFVLKTDAIEYAKSQKVST